MKELKNVLIIMLSLSVCLISFIISSRTKKRVKSLEKCILMLEEMETRIIYSCDNIYSIFEECSKNIELSFLNIFSASKSNDPLQIIWERCVESSKIYDCLKKEDVQILLSFGNLLGKTDCEGQIKNCIAHKRLLQSNLDRAVKDNEKRGNLITTLGVIGSLGIIVLLI